jgi:Fn3 associated/Pectate lyase superfamily protein
MMNHCAFGKVVVSLVATGLFLLIFSAEALPAPKVVETRYATEDIVIASAVVEPPASETDASGVIQAAIDEVAAAGGGVVFLPEGRYRLASPIVVKETVTLRGDWQCPAKDPKAASRGTLLMPTSGRGDADGTPAITVERGAGVRDATVWYPDQNPENIVPYPWTFRTSTTVNGDNYTIKNVTLVNPYNAFKTGPEGNELHTLRNVYGTPLNTGIWIDSTTDIGRVITVRFAPRYWEESGLPGAPGTSDAKATLRAALLDSAVGLDMGRSDWEYLYDIEIAGYSVGVKIRQGAQGTTNAVMFGSTLEDCGTALVLESLNGVGLAATGCRFTGSRHAVHAPASFETVSQFNSCEFECSADSAVLLEGSGTLTFQNCRFTGKKATAVEATAGKVTVMGCEFAGKSTHVALGADVRRARILGNTFKGSPQIVDESSDGDIMISHRAMEFRRPDTSLAPVPKHPRPASDALFVVTDFGASPDAEDNTAAFMKALAAAGANGGGTVYIPGGYYRFAGELDVPQGVELRGVHDVPHHTQSGGSVLMPTGGRDEENGTPFIRLETGSGLRGLTIWYPEQSLAAIVPYPWTVQSQGPRCWILDVVVSNAYQAIDFWTHPSDGHVIRYLSGATLKRGLFVSKCDGPGWVEDVQFNPHYGLRLPTGLPRPKYDGQPFNAIIAQQRHYLEGMVFGRCADEHLTRNFLYAAYDGLAFRDDAGGANARVINHGTDTGSRALVIAAAGSKGLEFINTQLVPLGDWEVGGLIVEETFTGEAALFNSQMWAGTCSAIVGGQGDVLIQQLNTVSGPMTLSGGWCRVENVRFDRDMEPHITVEDTCEEARLIANTSNGGPLAVKNLAGEKCRSLANSAAMRPEFSDGPDTLTTGWEPGQPQGLTDTAAKHGGTKAVSGAQCGPVDTQAHSGKHALRVAGNADESYAYAYFRLFTEPLQINPGATLTYWFMPVDDRARHVSIDLRFSDGKTLRDSGARTTDGAGVHPGTAKGKVGEWQRITVPLNRFVGKKTIEAVMVGYDSRGGAGPFEAFIDDLVIEAETPGAYQVSASPRGGVMQAPVRIALQSPEGTRVRYTLDGSTPGLGAPLYAKPIVLDKHGRHELRYAAELPDGTVSGRVFGELYEVR